MPFVRATFEKEFNRALNCIARAEKVTKAELRILSRTVLEAIYETGDVAFINKLLAILSPVNKKVAKLYFKEFSGFSLDETTGSFTTKSKKRYDKALANGRMFLEDPLNNIWTWAERNVEIETKDFSLDLVTEAFKAYMKKATKVGLTQKDVVKAVLSAGVEADTIIALMGEMYDFDVKTEQE